MVVVAPEQKSMAMQEQALLGKANLYYDAVFETLPVLLGKVVVVTGTTSGTGLILAVTAVRKGATCLILANRDSERATANLDAIRQMAASTVVKSVSCDLQSFASVRKAASEIETIVAQYSGLDVLCNNAGIMAHPDLRTEDGFDVQMQTNHLSHFLLTGLLLPSLEKAAAARGEARIIQHGSGARSWRGDLEAKFFEKCKAGTLGGNSFKASATRYTMSKLSNAVFALEMHHRLTEQASKIKSISCEPGVARTDLGANLFQAHKAQGSNFCIMSCLGCCILMGCNPTKGAGQTPADGAIPLMLACFGAETASGDLLMPKDPMKGGSAPVKPIAAGVEQSVERKRGTDEHRVMNQASGKLLWEASEAATGVKFL
eukprot:TRINITY_DN47430_c0_g1_i1.p1 TRINITY_DN47430_c0_g1~~TRINITY_DN47430_c0_g1_i1.p1  ORF type:complete len:374 (+),score=62.91 TRINITY_DN47430_c0_g1_i1:46-1167(+)